MPCPMVLDALSHVASVDSSTADVDNSVDVDVDNSVDVSLPSLHSVLHSYTSLNPLPFPWIVASDDPAIFCRIKVNLDKHVEVDFTVRVDPALKWRVFFKEQELDSRKYPLLAELPDCLGNIESVMQIINKLNGVQLCSGNPDDKYIELFKQRALTLHGTSSKE